MESAAKLADLRAQAWAEYANALRVSGRMPEAEEAFVNAQRFCREGTRDPLLRASLVARMASLRLFQRRFDEAIELSEEARRIYSEIGESSSVASAMVQKAIAQIYADEPAAAGRTLNRAIPLIDKESDPHLLWSACHNLIRTYIESGEREKALSLYFETRELYQRFENPLVALRAAWQEGQILRDLGRLRAAEKALLRARRGFVERELWYEVSMISLDLAAVYQQLGETEKLREIVTEMVPILKALRGDREVIRAFRQLQQAGQQSLRVPVDREEPEEQEVAAAAAPADSSRAFAAAEQAPDALLGEKREGDSALEELLAELAPLPPDEQERWVTTHQRFADPRLVRRLIEMSQAVRYEDPKRMLHLANLARLAADACTSS